MVGYSRCAAPRRLCCGAAWPQV